MLSDACFELTNDSDCLLDEKDKIARVNEFIKDVRHYSEDTWGYPKTVTDNLIKLADNFLESQDGRDLSALITGANATRLFYDALIGRSTNPVLLSLLAALGKELQPVEYDRKQTAINYIDMAEINEGIQELFGSPSGVKVQTPSAINQLPDQKEAIQKLFGGPSGVKTVSKVGGGVYKLPKVVTKTPRQIWDETEKAKNL